MDTTKQITAAQAGSGTPSIHPETMDPLLNWSLAMLNDIQRDVFAGLEEVQTGGRQSYGTTNPHKWLARYLDATQGKVPTVPGQPTKTAVSYLSYLSGIAASRIHGALRSPRSSWVQDPSMPTPISTPVTAHVAGQPWTRYVDYYDLAATGDGRYHPPLVRHLQSAAALTICYLTGCRAEEVYTLRRGCLEEMPPTAEGMTGFFINGTVWKRKGDGTPVKWPAGAPVADAVRVLERIGSEDAMWLISKVQGDRAKTDTVVRNLREFVEYCRVLTKSLPNPAGLEILEDSEGELTYERLRRTIGFAYWRQPDGDFVTGIQFKHTQAILGTQGYASYASLPTGAILRQEERQAQMDLLDDVAATLTAGTRVSGPASNRLIEAATRVKATLVSERESRQLLSDPDLRIFANPSQMSLCVYKSSTAMCAGTDKEPDRGACEASCGNHARTDVQIEEMRMDRQRLATEAASPLTPMPLADRLRGRAELLEKRIQDHEKTALAIKLEDEE